MSTGNKSSLHSETTGAFSTWSSQYILGILPKSIPYRVWLRSHSSPSVKSSPEEVTNFRRPHHRSRPKTASEVFTNPLTRWIIPACTFLRAYPPSQRIQSRLEAFAYRKQQWSPRLIPRQEGKPSINSFRPITASPTVIGSDQHRLRRIVRGFGVP